MSTPQIETEDGLVQSAPRQLITKTTRDRRGSVVRIAVALTIDVTVNDQVATPSISSIAVVSRIG